MLARKSMQTEDEEGGGQSTQGDPLTAENGNLLVLWSFDNKDYAFLVLVNNKKDNHAVKMLRSNNEELQLLHTFFLCDS